MKSLIIGQGQIGSALYEGIKNFHETYIRDVENLDLEGVEVLHICFPHSVNFVNQVKVYQETYKPSLTIIHSSIQAGDTNKLGLDTVYSPMRGRHPKLIEEIKIFKKFVAGYKDESVEKAMEYLESCGFDVIPSRSPHTLEICKLLSNIHMGLECAWAQEVGRILENFKADYEDYIDWEDTYNEGYLVVGDDHLIRPIMENKAIGGHCILECTDILSKSYPSLAFDFIKQSNEKKKTEENLATVA